tara:strand:- start:12 stop:1607 length:1596 start_codon:yes stop_codon:yes gene_type:complete
MGTFSKPGLTRGEERLVDKSGIAINQAIQILGTSFESQVAMINLNKNAALEQQMQVYKQASEIESSDASLGNNLAQALRLQADDLYKTTINTMGEDQTEALRKESNLIGSVENLGGNLEVINITAKKLQKMRQEGKSGLVSMNSNPKFMEFYSNIALYGGAGSKVNGVEAVESRIENGNIILSQKNSDGEIVEFSMQGNANAMANGGAPHISFVDSEAINGSYKTNWTGLTKDIPALVKQTEEYNKSKGITTNVDKIYEQQSSIAFEKMKNNKAEIALNNSDDFQYLTFTGNYKAGQGDTLDKDGNVLWTGSQEQRERVQLAKAEYAQQQFSNQNVRTKITENLPKPKTKTGTSKTGKGKKGKITKLNHTKFINTLDDLKGSGISIVPGVPNIKTTPANPNLIKGQVYKNMNRDSDDFEKIYKFDGKKYIELDKENYFKTKGDNTNQKIVEIKKYLENHPSSKVFRGDNAEVKASDSLNNPDPNKLYRKGGTIAKPTFIEIDFDNLFNLDVLDNLNKMEVALNKALGVNPI